jgi:hypothetical protein
MLFDRLSVVPLLFVRPLVVTVTVLLVGVDPDTAFHVGSFSVTAAFPAYPALVTRLDASTSLRIILFPFDESVCVTYT